MDLHLHGHLAVAQPEYFSRIMTNLQLLLLTDKITALLHYDSTKFLLINYHSSKLAGTDLTRASLRARSSQAAWKPHLAAFRSRLQPLSPATVPAHEKTARHPRLAQRIVSISGHAGGSWV